MLAGDRDVIKTELYNGVGWHELHLTPDSMVIFPSEYLSREIGIQPTIHRYSLMKDTGRAASSKPNLTFMLGIVDRESILPLANYFR